MFPSPLILLTALLLPFSTLTLAVPTPAPAQLTLSLLDNVNVLAGCPSMTIRCVKDSKWPSGIVGQLEGKREFVWEAPRCQQAEVRPLISTPGRPTESVADSDENFLSSDYSPRGTRTSAIGCLRSVKDDARLMLRSRSRSGNGRL